MSNPLRETVYQERSLAERVDETAGVIRGVKLLGEKSKNGRRYTAKAMREAVQLYNGAKSYTDHPRSEELSEDRKFRDWTGVYREARYIEGQGIFADWHLRKSSEYFEGILDVAKNFPSEIGLSHVAEGESRYEGETEIVESIKEVFSVDLVTSPATTNGLWESRRKKKTVREVIESEPDETTRKKLVEAFGAYGEVALDEESANPVAQLSALVKELVATLGETLKALAMKEDKPATPPPAEVDAETETEAETAEVTTVKKSVPPEFESLQKKLAEMEAKTALLESGREAKPSWIKALAAAEGDERKELLESLPVREVATEEPLPERSPPKFAESHVTASPERISEAFAALAR